MSIQDNIQEVSDRIADEIAQSETGSSATADELHVLAVAAIHSGSRRADGSIPAEWTAYMRKFAKNEEELAHLVPTDGTEDDPVKRDRRAYLVAGGTCTPGTTTGLGVPIGTTLNQ